MKKIKNSSALCALIDRFESCRIAVIGDLMMDTYVWGKVERISPEAPVPIVQVSKSSACLGGAANVMRNIVTLGGSVAALGVIGDDAHGKRLCELFQEYHIASDLLAVDATRPTINKQRVMSGSQQLLRIDYEDTGAIADAVRETLAQRVEKLLADGQIQALVLEDYAKGLFSQELAQRLVDAANRAGVLTSLDPNPRNPMHLNGLTIMKPNRSEAFALAGVPFVAESPERVEEDIELHRVAEILMQRYEVKNLLISLAAQGMALFKQDGSLCVIPTRAREVYDVSGAGDTVIAASILALAAGGDSVDAAEIANHAAGIVVAKLGTATVSATEVKESILHAK